MTKWDVNAFLGHWPFRKCRYTAWEHLRGEHEKNGISKGFVSSVQSVFWNDPMEAEEELAQALQGSGYGQVCTANPRLPHVDRFVAEAVERFDVKAVRICPTYHGYRLDDACLEPLGRALVQYGLPLYITVQLEDPRMNYVVSPRTMDVEELRAAADVFTQVNVLYCFLQAGDAAAMADLINGRDNLYVETSGFRGPSCCLESLLGQVDGRKILYGSAYTLYAMQSSLGCVERADFPDMVKRQILAENAARFFQRPSAI